MRRAIIFPVTIARKMGEANPAVEWANVAADSGASQRERSRAVWMPVPAGPFRAAAAAWVGLKAARWKWGNGR